LISKRWVLRNTRIRDFCLGYIKDSAIDEEAPFEVILRLYKKNRSLEQNDMFHAWCGTIAEQTGHSKGEIKDILIESVFGTEEYSNLQGETRSRLRATSEMGVKEMSELIERATQIGIELGAEVPEVRHG
jgi:DNA-directed RNA polymerase specialized sigma24 family protein